MRTAHWLRTAAAWAAMLAVLAQLMPEAITAGGPWVLLPFAGGLLLPSLFERLAAQWRAPGASAQTEAIAFDVGYAGLLVHAFGDGVAFFALSLEGRAWPMIALGLHIVPSTMVVALHAIREPEADGGPRQSLWAPIALGTGLFLATLLGFALGELVPVARVDAFLPWVIAGAGGVLLHVVFHASHIHSARKNA
ncbi:MAG: hypothetical protein U1E65_02420 [Myxococcota bacterium]